MTKVVLDSNLYVDWFNHGGHHTLMVGPGYIRYLSAIVAMELRVGARTKAAKRALDQLVRRTPQRDEWSPLLRACSTRRGWCSVPCEWPGARCDEPHWSTTFSLP